MIPFDNLRAGLQSGVQGTALPPDEQAVNAYAPQQVVRTDFLHESLNLNRVYGINIQQLNTKSATVQEVAQEVPLIDMSIVPLGSLSTLVGEHGSLADQLRAIQNPLYELLPGISYVSFGGARRIDVHRSEANARSESVEMRWLVRNSGFLSSYAGEWLLIQGEGLLAHSRDFQVIKAAIAEGGLRSPFVYYVPTAQESNSISI
jgi:hypothetical protein